MYSTLLTFVLLLLWITGKKHIIVNVIIYFVNVISIVNVIIIIVNVNYVGVYYEYGLGMPLNSPRLGMP